MEHKGYCECKDCGCRYSSDEVDSVLRENDSLKREVKKHEVYGLQANTQIKELEATIYGLNSANFKKQTEIDRLKKERDAWKKEHAELSGDIDVYIDGLARRFAVMKTPAKEPKMTFSPQSVIEWYRRRPTWQRLLLVFVIIVPLALAAVWWFCGRVTRPSDQDYAEILESVHDDRRKEAEERDKELAERIVEHEKAYQDKVKQREKIMEENEESHEKINDSSDDGIDSAIDDYNANRRR